MNKNYKNASNLFRKENKVYSKMYIWSSTAHGDVYHHLFINDIFNEGMLNINFNVKSCGYFRCQRDILNYFCKKRKKQAYLLYFLRWKLINLLYITYLWSPTYAKTTISPKNENFRRIIAQINWKKYWKSILFMHTTHSWKKFSWRYWVIPIRISSWKQCLMKNYFKFLPIGTRKGGKLKKKRKIKKPL